MTLLVISPDYASHALPLLALARAWADRGERVVVATGAAVAPLVAQAGFRHAPLVMSAGSNPGVIRVEDQPRGEDEVLAGFFEATRRGMIATLRYQADARARDLLWEPEVVARRTIDVVERVRPDVVAVDHLAFAATIGLRAVGVPYLDVVLGHPSALPVADEVYGVPSRWPAAIGVDPPAFEALRDRAGEVRDAFTARYVRALRTLAPGATPVRDAFAAHGDTVLYAYPEELGDPARAPHLPGKHAFLGSIARRESASADVAAWLERPDARPIVYVSFGSFLSARSDVLVRVVDALRRLRVRVALATGSTDVASLGALPSAWLVRPYLPQVALLARATIAVTHAGNNSVTEALTFGVPMLALPFSTDQFEGAAALERTGLGIALDPNRARPADIAVAVEELLGSSYRVRAAALGERLRADPGPERAHRAATLTAAA